MRNDPEVQKARAAFQVVWPRLPPAGWSGQLMGQGSGSSLEFQEHREYTPGDDLRHLDWAAYGRTDTLLMRLYREEVGPKTEVLVDASKSMTTGDGSKSKVARQLSGLLALLSASVGGRPVVRWLSETSDQRSFGLNGLELLETSEFSCTKPLGELLDVGRTALMKQAVRIVISDFLFPHDPAGLVRRLATGASMLWLVQILTGFEAKPWPVGGRRLIDVEADTGYDLLIDSEAVARYQQRLAHLQEELARNCRRARGRFVSLVADRGLIPLCRNDLCRAGLLRPI